MKIPAWLNFLLVILGHILLVIGGTYLFLLGLAWTLDLSGPIHPLISISAYLFTLLILSIPLVWLMRAHNLRYVISNLAPEPDKAVKTR